MPATRIERPDDLTADWLTAAIGAGTVDRVQHRADRHRPDERVLPGRADVCRRCRRPGIGGAQGRGHRSGEQADGPGARPLRARGAVLHRYRAAASAVPSRPVTTLGASTARRACSTCCSGMPLLPSSATRSAAPQSNRRCWRWQSWGGCTGRCSGQASMAEVEWLNREAPMNQALIAQLYAGFIDRYGDRDRTRASRGVRTAGRQLRRVPRRRHRTFVHGLVHGDYRLDNMLFGQPGADRPLTVVDWQTVTWGPAMIDVAYFLGCALPDDVRRDNYDALLRRLPRCARAGSRTQPGRRSRRRSPPEPSSV